MPFNKPPQNIAPDPNVNEAVEQELSIPWLFDPALSYLYYDCVVETMLDSGIVVHNRLPQQDRYVDTLSSVDFDNINLNELQSDGVNLKSQDQYKDIVQRMGHSRYWFRLSGQAIRAGYKIPIPSIKTIGGVPAIPYDRNPQWAYCKPVPGGNFGGVILWHAQWLLWYTTAVPPVNNNLPANDPSSFIRGTTKPPTDGIQAPYSASDDNAKSFTLSTPGIAPGITIGGK